jgi:hypothetical protein
LFLENAIFNTGNPCTRKRIETKFSRPQKVNQSGESRFEFPIPVFQPKRVVLSSVYICMNSSFSSYNNLEMNEFFIKFGMEISHWSLVHSSLFNFLQLVIPTREVHRGVRWDKESLLSRLVVSLILSCAYTRLKRRNHYINF